MHYLTGGQPVVWDTSTGWVASVGSLLVVDYPLKISSTLLLYYIGLKPGTV